MGVEFWYFKSNMVEYEWHIYTPALFGKENVQQNQTTIRNGQNWFWINCSKTHSRSSSVLEYHRSFWSPGWADEIRGDRVVYFGICEYSVIMICLTVWHQWMVNLFLFAQSLMHTSVVYRTLQLLCFRSGTPNKTGLNWIWETFSLDRALYTVPAREQQLTYEANIIKILQ